MRRAVWLLVVASLVALSVTDADAQFRLRKKRAAPPPGPPAISFTLPTDQVTHQTDATSLVLEGVSIDGGVGTTVSVTWANAATGASGVCTITAVVGNQASFSCGTGGGGNTTVYQSTFTTSSQLDLSAYTPAVGGSCAEVLDTAGTLSIIVRTEGHARPLISSTGNALIYTCTSDPAISGNAWTAAHALSSSLGTNEPVARIWRWSDSNNYCWLKQYNATANPDLVWGKKESGTNTTLGSANVGPLSSTEIMVERSGSNFRVLAGGAEVIAPVASTFCDDNNVIGLGFGAVNGVGTDQVSTASRFDYSTVVDTNASSAIALNSGANVITITATDNDSLPSTKVMTVTRGTDNQAPVISIDQPTSLATYSTSTQALVVSGAVSDNVTATSADARINGGSWVGCTLSGSGVDKTFVCPSVSQSAGANTIDVRALDAAANTGTDSLASTYTATDSTDPVVTITSDGGSGAGANYSTAAETAIISGTASDAVGVVAVSASSSTGVVPATGTTNWSVTKSLAVGANVITVTALDEAGNDGTDTVTITRTGAALTVSTTSLAVGTVGLLYNSCLNASGGTGPYAWTKVSGTLPSGLSLSGNCITGTPGAGTQGSYTTHVYRATDSAGSPDTEDTPAMTLTIGVAGTGRNAYFETIIQRSDMKVAFSGRPVSGTTCTQTHNGKSFASGSITAGTCNPYFATQLTNKVNNGGYRSGDSAGVTEARFAEYIYDTDTDPEKADGFKTMMPAYGSVGPLLGAVNTTSPTSIVFTETLGIVTSEVANASFRIDDEIVSCDPTVGDANPVTAGNQCAYESPAGTWTMYVRRGQFGTTATTHTSGTVVKRTVNGWAGGTILLFPISGTSQGHTYLLSWDFITTSSYLGIQPNLGNKTYQIRTTSTNDVRRFEPKMNFSGNTAGATVGASNVKCVGDSSEAFDNNTKHAFAWATRVYNLPYTGAASWAESDGLRVGPNASISSEHLTPQASNATCVRVNRWTRVWYRIQINATDYDILDAWIADTVRDPIQMFSGIQTSIYPGPDGVKRLADLKVQFNDSYGFHTLSSLPAFNPFRDRVKYISNIYVLEDPPADLVAAGILVKPE